MFKNQTFEMDFAGRKLSVEVGKMANQTNASCLVSYGETVILATAVMAKEPRLGIDFFPLSVEMQEKMYAAGKIKGSKFVKRDGRPTDNAVLDSRMIDRGLRPLFNQEMRHEVQVITTILSYDEENSANILAITASAIALHISDIPWNGPLAGVCIGRVEGEFIFNPTVSQLAKSDLKVVFSAAHDKVLMIDAEAHELAEDDMMKAIDLGLEKVKPLLDFINDIRSQIGLPKQDEAKLIEAAQVGGEISMAEKKETFEEAKKFFAPQLDKYLFNQPKGTKRERKEVAKELLKKFIEQLKTQEKHEEVIAYIEEHFEIYLEEEVTKAILEKELRIDGRKLNEIRPLSAEVGLLPRTHGSALFSRGETQVLSIVTLGAPGDAQILDEMTESETKKTYIHYYNALSFCYGETGQIRSAGRREIGHGALAEKALMPVLPNKEDFPYTILVVSEVMGSNGSSSMASTCGSTLTLMDAGVPIKRPVAGIAMGLASNDKGYKILTDLQDLEDGEGGMDFKVTGTTVGITAIQMDTKTTGLSREICQKTLIQAREARVQILDVITKAIPAPRAEMSKYAPRIVTLRINPDKIREVIGSGGKVINEIIDACGVAIDIEDDGLVAITGSNPEGVAKAVKWVEGIVKEVEAGEVYAGKVTRLMDFGAFVEILPGKEGLVHISEFSTQRVEKITDVANIGDELKVKVIEVDDKGRINLSVKRADPNYAGNDDGGSRPSRPSFPRRDNNRGGDRDRRRSF
ncbi:MAG: polyribonucleotide nucleotidyltransferase [Patescibacteria group bacterium]|jgi:polyribonucleotide nucleotidyltransferase